MSPGRKTALVGGAIVALLVISVAALWKEIIVAYHVSRLRDDPALIAAWISERGDSARRIALGRYARTTRGIEALRRHCLGFVFDCLAAGHPEFLPGAVPAFRLTTAAALVGGIIYVVALTASFFLPEPPRQQMAD